MAVAILRVSGIRGTHETVLEMSAAVPEIPF